MRTNSHIEKKPMQLPKEGQLPFVGKCLTESVVYQATVTKEDGSATETYVGLTEGPFKSRILNHISSFRNPKIKHGTELSKDVWNLKNSKTPHSVRLRILQLYNPHSAETKQCNLCLHKKFHHNLPTGTEFT